MSYFNQSSSSETDDYGYRTDSYEIESELKKQLSKRLALIAKMNAMAEYSGGSGAGGDYYESTPMMGFQYGPAYAIGGNKYSLYSDKYGSFNDQSKVGEAGFRGDNYKLSAAIREGRKPTYSAGVNIPNAYGDLSANYNYSPLAQAIMLRFNRSF